MPISTRQGKERNSFLIPVGLSGFMKLTRDYLPQLKEEKTADNDKFCQELQNLRM